MKKTRLLTIGGKGAENHERLDGKFEVRSYELWQFKSLIEAFQCYTRLNYPASLYDITEVPHVCLEIKVFKEFNSLGSEMH